MAAAVQHLPQIPSFSTSMVEPSAGTVEYVPNPYFVFPGPPDSESNVSTNSPRRTTSLRLNPSPASRRNAPGHKSVSVLPTFSFNATDTSGRMDVESTSESAGQMPPTTPQISGHRRRASELVGGDARYGVPDLISTSPIKSTETHLSADTAPSTGSPVKKRGHAHRRSAAISSHDIASIMQAPSTMASDEGRNVALPSFSALGRYSSGASMPPSPTTALAPSQPPTTIVDIRPRVGFSDNVQVIPRPLSTIESDIESSMSTPASLSARHSVSSVVDFGSMSPSVTTRTTSLLGQKLDVEIPASQRSSLELSRGLDHEGHWLRKEMGPSPSVPLSPLDSSQASKVSFLLPTVNLDRRKSEPSLILGANHGQNRSSVSLQEPMQSPQLQQSGLEPEAQRMERRASVRKVRAWANAIMHRKEKDIVRPKSADSAQRSRLQSTTSATSLPSVTVSPSEEPDLEELFSHDPFSEKSNEPAMPLPRIDFGDVSVFQPSFNDMDDSNPVIDLDAALGPNNTPSRQGRPQGFGARRQLHSSRLNRDFSGPGGHYHRRTESAPVLAHFDFVKSSSPVQSPMADVFEEDEEHADQEETVSPTYSTSEPSSAVAGAEFAVEQPENIAQCADIAVEPSTTSSTASEGGLGIQQSVGTVDTGSTHRSACTFDRRPSVIEDTIVEEGSQIEIVEDDEEPRASTLTKSSDSSDTPTVMDYSGPILSLPAAQSTLMTPTTYAASTFSTPDFTRRQGSFDGSRMGTSASSMTDCRTMSSFAGDAGHGVRTSSDDVPSLTSSRSTMISSMHQGGPRRDISDGSVSTASTQQSKSQSQSSEQEQSERRRKRSSIQSLTKLVGSSFSDSRSRLNSDQRSQTSTSSPRAQDPKKKKENRLSRLMFWKSKNVPRAGSFSK